MHGNVYEWCWDMFGSEYYVDGQVNPLGPNSGNERVVRGGAFYTPGGNCRSAKREGRDPDTAVGFVGFRIVRWAD